MENALPTRAFPVIAVLALILFHPGTAAAQPHPDTLTADSPNRPPTSAQLAFVRDGQIFLINADGTGLIQLTDYEPDIENRDPAWSRDGQRLAFARNSIEGGPWDIHIMNADGSKVIQLTSGGYNVEPAWGPDDKAILFSGPLGLTVIDVDDLGSAGSTVLLDYPGFVAQPAWSPDGQTITFTSDYRAYDFLYDLYAMNADGSDVRRLLEGPFFDADGRLFYFQSAWSPDGQSIAVVVCPYAWDDCYTNGSEIAVAKADGSDLTAIAQAGGFARPTWSPDGQWIAFGSTACRTCASYIRFVSVDGGAEGLLIENGHSPSWRPERGASINVGHSGSWFNPATPGQGQFLEVEPDRQFVFLGWLTYTDEASDHPNEQHWFTAEGHYSDSRAELILYESSGGEFNHAQPVVTTPVGEATLTFSDCGQGTMSYRFDDRDLEGSFPMVRAIPGSGSVCESLSKMTTQTVNVNHGKDGAWFDPNTSGQGFLFDVHAGDDGTEFILVSWFTYGDDTASGQRWLTAEGQFEGSSADLKIYESSGGSFNSVNPVATVAVGTMSILFKDCNHALLTYSLPGEEIGGNIELQRAMPVGDSVCE